MWPQFEKKKLAKNDVKILPAKKRNKKNKFKN